MTVYIATLCNISAWQCNAVRKLTAIAVKFATIEALASVIELYKIKILQAKYNQANRCFEGNKLSSNCKAKSDAKMKF